MKRILSLMGSAHKSCANDIAFIQCHLVYRVFLIKWYSGHLPYSSTYLGYSHQYSQQQMPISSSRYPTVHNTGVLMCQPNVPILQPCPMIIDGSAPVVGKSIPFIPVHPCGNPFVTTPSLEPLNSSGLV